MVYAFGMTEARARYITARDRPQLAPGRRVNNMRPAKRAPHRQLSAAEAGFPGCETVPMNARQFEHCDRHVEYWDARNGVAWMVREASIEHERPLSRLAVLVHRIAQERDAAMLCCGTTSLHDRDAKGDVRVMEADQAIYLDGKSAQALRSPILVREGQAPDVVLEVDHTTDARRRKLGVYEEWGVPEVWVEVPDAPARSRPKSRRSGLTIHVLDENTDRYREASASEALLGSTAAEIHLALNEGSFSKRTWAAVARVGKAMRAKEGGAVASDAPQAGVVAYANVHDSAEQLAAQAIASERAAVVYAILAKRGIHFAPHFLADASALLEAHDTDRIVEAALACDSAADFLALMA